jgi:hypothetical protein
MATENKEKSVELLIDKFAAQLLELNDGKAIPLQWKNRLLKAIRPERKRRGTKADYSRMTAVSKELTRNRTRLAAPDRTKKDKRGEVKQAIADSQKKKTSIRTVERIAEKQRQLLDASADVKPLDAAGQATIDGIFQATSEEMTAEQRTVQAAEGEAALRKFGLRKFREWVAFTKDNFEPHNAIYFDNRWVETKDDLLQLIKDMEEA